MIRSKYGENRPASRSGEVNSMPSEVLPNQSYTLRELIARYRCGQRLPVSFGLEYYDNDDVSEVPIERSPEFSMEDAFMYQQAVERRIRLRKEFAEQQQGSTSDGQKVAKKGDGSSGSSDVPKDGSTE